MDISIGSLTNWASAPAPLPADQGVQRRQITKAVAAINQSGALGQDQLVFLVDSATHRPIIRVENRETHDVVLQIPPEYVLRLAEDLRKGLAVTIPGPADT